MKVLIFLLLSWPLFVSSQSFSGYVRNKNQHPLYGAKVTVYRYDSSIVTSAFSDTAGKYDMSFRDSMAAFMIVSLNGYSSGLRTLTDKMSFDFILSDSISSSFEGTSLVVKKPVLEYKADRTVFNVENSIAATGGDAVDAIKRAPGVSVNNNQISISGKGSVSVMINGRLQQLSGDDLMQMLHSIPSDNIAKIEIITSPSARYDAEGNSGIINIILKKNRQKGFRCQTTISHEYNTGLNFPTGSLSVYYKKDRLSLFGTANGGVQGYPYTAYVNTYYGDQYMKQNTKYPYINNFARLQFGGDYALNKKSNIGFTVSEGFSGLNNNEYILASMFRSDGTLDSTITTTGKTTDKFLGTLTSNLNYEMRLDSSGKKVNIDLDYYRQLGKRYREFTIQNNDIAGASVTERTSRVSSRPLTEIKSAKIDFEMPYENFRLNYGAKMSVAYNVMNNLFENRSGTAYFRDTTKSNDFNYRESIQAAYITFGKSFKKLELSAGLRLEHTTGVGVLVTSSQTNKLDYTKLFPSTSLQYKLRKNHLLNLNFYRRINRPGYGLLNPFRYYYTASTYSEGNPKLKPSVSYSTDFGYVYKSNLNIRASYYYVSNYFDARVSFVDTVKKTNAFTRKNLGNRKYINLNISGNIEIAKWWNFIGEINGGFSRFTPFDKTGKSDYSGIYGYIDVNNSFTLNKIKTWTAELNYYYYTPRQRDYVYWEKMTSVSIGMRYAMFKKNLILSFYADDIFARSYWLQTNKLNNTREFSYDGHSFRLTLSYKFGNKSIQGKQIRSMEELQRTGN